MLFFVWPCVCDAVPPVMRLIDVRFAVILVELM
jgi:hypothetical protein